MPRTAGSAEIDDQPAEGSAIIDEGTRGVAEIDARSTWWRHHLDGEYARPGGFADLESPVVWSPTTTVPGVAGLMQFRAFNVPPATTAYMTPAGADSDLIDANEPVALGTAGLLTCEANDAPGVGQTFTYTVLRNGLATNLQVVLSGDSETVDFVEIDEAFLQNAKLAVRLVTSAGAAQTKHKATLKYTPD